MTSDTELRDLLTSEAAGPSTGAGWDDVVRRGRRRQRTRRAQVLALSAIAGMAVVTAISLSGDDPTLETTPPVTEPTTTLSYETTTSRSVDLPPGELPRDLGAARVQGAFLTVIIPAADPTIGFDPCTDVHPRTPQSAEQIAIALETEDEWRGEPWAACQSSPFSAFGTIELQEPYAGQPVLDLSTGETITVIDGGPLLFPGAGTLPEPFDMEHWDEFGGAPAGTWTFSWSQDDLFLNVTTSSSGWGHCDRESIEVRGTPGHLCRGDRGRFELQWQEDGLTIAIEIGHVSDGYAPFSLDDVLAIAEGLEPLGG